MFPNAQRGALPFFRSGEPRRRSFQSGNARFLPSREAMRRRSETFFSRFLALPSAADACRLHFPPPQRGEGLTTPKRRGIIKHPVKVR